MNYSGKLYGKVGRKHFPLQMSAQDVDLLVHACENTMQAIEVGAEWSRDPVVDDDTWNEDAHIQLTLTIRDCRLLKSVIAKATGKEAASE